MINIVYGYCVKHGGIGRYIAETLKHAKEPWNYNVVTMESNIGLPEETSVHKVDCSRNPVFMSADENKAFSEAIKRCLDMLGGAITHSHGVYDLIPNLYTAHICLSAYFRAIEETTGLAALRGVVKDFEYMIDTESRMVTSIPEERIVAVSSKVARELSQAYGLEREKIRITPGASRFPLSSKTKRNAKKGYVIGFVGGNVYTKGIALLADVIDELHRRGIETRCVGAGCGKDVEDFLQGRCRFESLGKYEILPSFYQGLDCFASLGSYEAWSLSTIEAMSQMVPVVSTKGNGVFEGAEGKFALADRSVAQIADVIERVLTDDEFREIVVKSGIGIVNRLNWEESARRYEELYAELL